MFFASDNVTEANPEVLEAVVKANSGNAMPYGDDPISEQVRARFEEIFERPCQVHFGVTGSAVNSLALASLVRPYQAIISTALAHINTDECGAPEMFTGGAKVIDVPTSDGRLSPQGLKDGIDIAIPGFVHRVEPGAVSITQSTETGSVYSCDQVAELVDIASHYKMAVHMDGARFANGLVAAGCSPAEMTKGVDVLTFGGSKNGCMTAEAAIFFCDPEKIDGANYRAKRAGMLTSKMRFISSQFLGHLENDLWLKNARHANAMATKLGQGLSVLPGIGLAAPVEANMVFVTITDAVAAYLESKGAKFYFIGDFFTPAYRLVTAWNTPEAEVDRFIATAKEACFTC